MRTGRERRLGLIASLIVLLIAGMPLTVGAVNLGDRADYTAEGPAVPAATASNTFRVYAHRQGLVGHTTANGHVIQENDHFVALPCKCALSSKGGHEFQVRIEYKGRTTIAPVWDVGPWNIDDNYWDPPEKRKYSDVAQGVPQAAAAYYNDHNDGRDGSGRTVLSPAGIDIADGTFWHELGMTGSDWVNVTFLWLEPETEELPPLPAGYEHLETVRFGERPPLDRVPPSDDPFYTYFPETGHNVAQPLMDYWYANGGWRNIGLPITELFREVGANGRVRLVQYFERQILQLNLPPSDLPLVQSDLIGYAAYAPPQARAPVGAFTSNDNHWYFPETQHSLNNGMKNHWIKYGGLTAFGYPITEEFSGTTPDGRKYVAQIFERARLEWWPDKVGTDEEITHGLLVTELLRQSGWIE